MTYQKDETKYSKDGYKVVAMYDIDDDGNIIPNTVCYVIIGPNGEVIGSPSSLEDAVAGMNTIIDKKNIPNPKPKI